MMCVGINHLIEFQYFTNNLIIYNFDNFLWSQLSADTKFLPIFNPGYLKSVESSSFKNLAAREPNESYNFSEIRKNE